MLGPRARRPLVGPCLSPRCSLLALRHPASHLLPSCRQDRGRASWLQLYRPCAHGAPTGSRALKQAGLWQQPGEPGRFLGGGMMWSSGTPAHRDPICFVHSLWKCRKAMASGQVSGCAGRWETPEHWATSAHCPFSVFEQTTPTPVQNPTCQV